MGLCVIGRMVAVATSRLVNLFHWQLECLDQQELSTLLTEQAHAVGRSWNETRSACVGSVKAAMTGVQMRIVSKCTQFVACENELPGPGQWSAQCKTRTLFILLVF